MVQSSQLSPQGSARMRVLVTGGLGFIFHSDDGALRRLDPRVKGIIGDVPNSDDVARALRDVDAVVHPVALTGVGQSIYELDRYVDVNCRGTTTQLNGIVRQVPAPRRFVLASSRAILRRGRLRFCRPRHENW